MIEKLNEYQELACRTAAKDEDHDRALAILGLGICGEAGEVADYLKKVLGHGHTFEPEKLSRELGDLLWYIATIAARTGLSLESVADTNIAKLKARYPKGFSTERSVNRAPSDS